MTRGMQLLLAAVYCGGASVAHDRTDPLHTPQVDPIVTGARISLQPCTLPGQWAHNGSSFVWRQSAGDLCLSAAGTRPGSLVSMQRCDSAATQMWTLSTVSQRLLNPSLNVCAMVKGGATSAKVGDLIDTWGCVDKDNEKFVFNSSARNIAVARLLPKLCLVPQPAPPGPAPPTPLPAARQSLAPTCHSTKR